MGENMAQAIIRVYDTPDGDYGFDVSIQFDPPYKLGMCCDCGGDAELYSSPAQEFAMELLAKLREKRGIKP